MHHVVKKQIFNLSLETEQDAFYLQHRVSNYNQREIVLVLQKVFDEMCADGQSIYIDKLEIDLGNISVKEIQNDQWADLFETSLRDQLKKISGTSQTGKSIIREPEILSIFRQWLYSTKKGYLPWNARQIDEMWYAKVLEAIATDHKVADELRSLLKSNAIVIERIVLQHPISFLISVTELLTAEKQDKLLNVAEDFFIVTQFLQKKEEGKIILNKRNIETITWKKIISEAAVVSTTTTNRLTAHLIIEQLIRTFFSAAQITQLLRSKAIVSSLSVTQQAFKKIAGEISTKENNVQQNIEYDFSEKPGKVIKGDKPVSPATGENNLIQNDSGTDESVVSPKEINVQRVIENNYSDQTDELIFKENKLVPATQENNLIQNDSKSTGQKAINPGSTEVAKNMINAIRENEIFVQNAGIVLLHPFLNSFFKLLGHVKEGQFHTSDAHRKALYLVHFLATGNTEAHEHDLVITKIICAYPLDKPVDSFIELTEIEIQEADNLLAAVIERWEILKSTSSAGLREGFLQRDGKLHVKNGELYLQVETSSIDILLDYLPWNLSIVKLPWMENILRVEWR